MIVTIVTDVLGEANNGTTIAAMHLIDSLRKKGHDVRVLCPDADKKGHANYYVVPTINFGPFQPIVDHNGVSLAKDDTMTVARAIHDADEVHIMMPFAIGRKAACLCHDFGVPVSAGFHVQAENVTAHFFNWMGNTAINKAIYRNFWSHFYKYIDAIHYPTQFIRDEFESVIKRTTPGYVISNGISAAFVKKDIERSPELSGKFVILCTGRLSKEKRQGLLIKAAKLSKWSDEIQIVFAGEGPRYNELQRLIRKTKLRNAPIFRFFKRDELVDAINMADLYVHTSEIEIEAISCLEAIAGGLVPLINDSKKSATRCFALDDKDLFRLNDPQDLANKIDYWHDHPDEKAARAKEYQKFCGQFNFERCMDEMEKMIEDTAKIKKEPAHRKP
jgi:glycosyltransferase involved in cell wall biosynthesis